MKKDPRIAIMEEIPHIFNKRPLIIAGPCSAESRTQMMNCAQQLRETNQATIFRAGIWKPRTRPGQFEGSGDEGLKWLLEVKQTFNFPVITEVATTKHVEKVLKAGIDMIWIGARTTSNPFSIHEISKALEGVDIPVFVKNPANPDLDLWIGAIERFKNAGIRQIAAIHRGFYPYEPTKYRNIPKWEVPIELKTRIPDLPILCDPSHIGGARANILEVAQYAYDIMMDGLMIEVHPNPDVAKTDSKQQLTPKEFGEVMSNLIIRVQGDLNPPSQLERMRMQIDSIDQQLIDLLGKRFDISRNIANYKKDLNLAPFQLKRWRSIIDSRKLQAKNIGINPDFIMKLLQSIHKESIAIQNEIMKKP